MDLKEIQNLIKFVANSGVAEVKLEMDDVKITIRTTLEGNVTETTYVQQLPAQAALPQAVAPQQAPAVVSVTSEASVPAEDSKFITIKSPIIGTFTENHLRTNQYLLKLEVLFLKVMFFV